MEPQDVGKITGAVVAVVSLIVIVTSIIVVVVVAVYICKKPKRHFKRNNSMISNAAYGTTYQNNVAATYRKGDTYDYPRFGYRLKWSVRAKAKQDKVHNATIETRPSEVYAMSIMSQKNEAYGTSLSNDNPDLEYSYVRYI